VVACATNIFLDNESILISLETEDIYKEINMLAVNEYFGGKVKSIGLNNSKGKSTVGVMDIGDYEFGTSMVEYMTVVTGALNVLLPEAKEWKMFSAGETFIVAANTKFQLKVAEQTAYLCRYE
jgi:hypothetical protein